MERKKMVITSFWRNIESLCNDNGIAPSALAKQLNLSPSAAAKWRNGAIPQRATLKKIAEHFNVSVDYILQAHDAEFAANTYRQAIEDFNRRLRKMRIPVLGRVAAGVPIEQIVDVDDYEDISEAMAANGDYFALKIHGDSMQPRMCENDVIIVRKQETVENGETAVVSINGLDATCKKIEFTEDGITLISTNPAYSPMHFTQKQINDLPIRILGKVVEIRCKL